MAGRWRATLAGLLAAGAALAGFALSPAGGAGAAGGDVGVVAGSASQTDRVAASGAGWVAFASSWTLLEPQNGSYAQSAWDALAAEVSNAKSKGLRVELTLSGAPAWAANAPGNGSPPAPQNYGRYAGFLKDLAARIGPSVDAWSPWNEPNHPNFWSSPDPAAYTKLQQAVYPALKSADPTATVLSATMAPTGPGLNGNGGGGSIDPYDFLTRAYDAGLKGSVDAIAWNMYPPGAPEDSFTDSSGRPYPGSLPGQLYVHDLLQSRDPGRHVWITEIGWSTCPSCQQNRINGTNEATQADYLSRAWSYKRRYLPWVDVMFWYQASDIGGQSAWERGLGLLRSDGSTKPSYAALSGVANSGGTSGGGASTSGGGGAGGGTTSPTTKTGTSTTPRKKPAPYCATAATVRRSKKTVLAVGGFAPRAKKGFFQLQLVVTTKAKTPATVTFDARRGTSWKVVTHVNLKRSSKVSVKIRDRGYSAIRVRAHSRYGNACRARAALLK